MHHSLGTIHSENPSIRECAQYLEASPPYMHKKKPKLEELEINASQPKPLTQEPPTLELKHIKMKKIEEEEEEDAFEILFGW